MSVASKLLTLDAVKDEIKAKIGTNLGRTIGAAVPFTDYADYILPPVAWMPDPLWASLDDIADGQIGMIVRDRDDLGVAARCAFTITATASYVVDWGDGTAPETVASTVMADHTYTLGAGTPDSKGTTTFKVRISSTGTIQRIQMAGNVTGGVVTQTVQSVNIKAAGITSMDSAFAYCSLLQSCTMVALNSCASFASAFSTCSSLVSLGNISSTGCTSIALMCIRCSSLLSVGNLTLPECVAITSAFAQCFNLRSIGDISAPKSNTIQSALLDCYNLVSIGSLSDVGTLATSVNGSAFMNYSKYSGAINLTNAKLSKISCAATAALMSSITGLTFHASSAFGGGSPQIDISYSLFNRTALIALFNILPTLVGKTINITGCIGTADLTAGDRAIATGKGWTITG